MKFLFDLLPVILFFVAFKLGDIYVATGTAIVASICQVAWLKLRKKKVDTMLWASLAIIVVFGGAALLFRRNLVRIMLSEQVQLPDPVWNRLNWSWVGFFALMGALNLYVAYNYSTDLWVNFKVFGGAGLMLVFVVVQALFLARHVEDKQ